VGDRSIPFVHGTPVSIPYFFTVQAPAVRILEPKFQRIVAALQPGGSGDMCAGLNEEEREALLEVTRFGFPPRAWFNLQKIVFGYTGVFTTLVDRIVDGDPTYFRRFPVRARLSRLRSPRVSEEGTHSASDEDRRARDAGRGTQGCRLRCQLRRRKVVSTFRLRSSLPICRQEIFRAPPSLSRVAARRDTFSISQV
jgi:hypothetical protein